MPGNALHIGGIIGNGQPLTLPASARERHVYVCGGTGVGKSKFIEHCIRQDILNWSDTHCGLILCDPHGLVYKNIMAWLARHNLKRPIIPIDLRRDDWIVSYNMLRRRKNADPAVIVANFIRALSHVWGQRGTDFTPQFARIGGVLLLTLYENGCTIADVMHLLSRPDIRRAMAAKMTDLTAKQVWESADRHPKEFQRDILSTLNRFNRLSGPQVMRATMGQPDVSLDLSESLAKGHIILVNLSTEGGQIDEEDADTFATLLLSDLWSAAKARGKNERGMSHPFYVYIDECQNFITPTIANNLDQARGFGLHLTLANQFPSQLLNAGANGKAMHDSILANAGTKIVFRTEHPEDMKPLAQWLFMNTLDTDQVKLTLEATRVLGYREETRQRRTVGRSAGRKRSRGANASRRKGMSMGLGASGKLDYDLERWEPIEVEDISVERWNANIAFSADETTGASVEEGETDGMTESISEDTVQVPELGKEVASVQFRPIDEQLFRAMQKLFDQEDRHFAIRFHGGPRAPLFVKTPTVKSSSVVQRSVESYRRHRLEELPFALRMPEAVKRLNDREHYLLNHFVDAYADDEPITAKRKIQ
jgi:hypothetical protein